ncbi:MAG: TRAP transporter substrate-binding protein DctP, partial [Clostridia bacterium]|nr:TRAP transporter substrate-binding protein DctP [Clostridia bacterium]
GALPVSVPTPDQYTALQRGTVDGTFYYHSGLKDYKLEEVVRFATDGAALTSADLAYVINESLWKRLDPAVQEAMRQAAEEVMPQVAAYLDEDTRTSVQQYEAKGIQILRLTDADKKAWQDALQPVRDKWVKDMEAKGRPGGQVLAAWAEARQRAGR